MEPIRLIEWNVAPLDRVNVDTDQIIPKQFLKRVERTGFGEFLFYDWRYLEDGSENPDFILNQNSYRDASILVSGRNFGSGSSREHAPWALQDFGIKCILAPSFADIFYNNCFQNGVLPIVLPEDVVQNIIFHISAQNLSPWGCKKVREAIPLHFVFSFVHIRLSGFELWPFQWKNND